MGQFNKQDTLILVALESELPKESVPQWNVQYIGVGKVNAALAVCRFSQKFKPKVSKNSLVDGTRIKMSLLQRLTRKRKVPWS